jgi:hypothetical protein
VRKSSVRFLGILGLFCLPLILVLLIGASQNIITPNEQFFTNYKGQVPQLDTSSWTLTIDGNVKNPTVYPYDQFIARPTKSQISTIQCVEGYSGTAEWKGVELKDLLDIAEVKDGTIDIIFYAADGYSSSLTLEEAIKSDVMLAFRMNGEALPAVQGYPVRLVAPGHWGYKWVMWVERIEVTNYDYIGFWESRGWSDNAQITPYAQWSVHAILFSIALILGGIALMTGLKFSREYDYFKDLPNFINRKFHMIISITYAVFLISILIFWFGQTFLSRGSILYTVHGYLALSTVILQIIGVISGIRRIRRGPTRKNWHFNTNLYSFILLIVTILLGFLLTRGMRFLS